MTDIVKRLRGTLRGAFPIDETMSEAADEIERLREALEKIASGDHDGGVRQFARAALQKDKGE